MVKDLKSESSATIPLFYVAQDMVTLIILYLKLPKLPKRKHWCFFNLLWLQTNRIVSLWSYDLYGISQSACVLLWIKRYDSSWRDLLIIRSQSITNIFNFILRLQFIGSEKHATKIVSALGINQVTLYISKTQSRLIKTRVQIKLYLKYNKPNSSTFMPIWTNALVWVRI